MLYITTPLGRCTSARHAVLTLLCLTLALGACKDDKRAMQPAGSQPSSGTQPGGAETLTVTFNTNGGTTIDPVRVDPGKTVARPADPQKKAGVFDIGFDKWYADADFKEEFKFDQPINSSVTLYAKYDESVYLVSTAEQLQAIGEEQNLSKRYRLTADITLAKDWTPLGKLAADGNGVADLALSKPFAGELDGAGHVVKNLRIDLHSQIGIGLIAYNTGLAKRLGLELAVQGNFSIGGGSYTGALAGYNAGVIEEAYVKGGSVNGGAAQHIGGLVGYNSFLVYGYAEEAKVFSSGSGERVGGLVGSNYGGSVYGYAEDATVSGGASSKGGLVGVNDGGGTVYGYAYRMAIDGGDAKQGGLVGVNDGSGTVYGYTVGGAVSGGLATSGGLVGDNNNGTLYGYARVAVSRARGADLCFGKLAGHYLYVNVVKGYSSDKKDNAGNLTESAINGFKAGEMRMGNDGTSIMVEAATKQDAFGEFTFLGPQAGQWVWAKDGAWPAIWLPAEVGGKYKAEDQPTAP